MRKEFKYLKKHKALTESKSSNKTFNNKIDENVLVVNDGEIFKVSKVIDIPKKLINALLKKAKEETGKDPKVFWNDVAVADEIVKYIIDNYLNSESLPASILMGDTSLSNQIVDDEGNETDEYDSEDDSEEDFEESEEDNDDFDESEESEEDNEEIPSLEDDEDDDEEIELPEDL